MGDVLAHLLKTLERYLEDLSQAHDALLTVELALSALNL